MLAAILLAPPTTGLLVRPYVQLGDAPDAGRGSVALMYHTSEAEGYTLQYRVGDAPFRPAPETARRVEVDGTAPFSVHTARLSGLRGGRVEWRLLQGGAEVARNSFAAPKGEREPYRFAVFGDCGRATRGQARIAGQTLRANPDLLVMTGDLVYDRGEISEYTEKFWPYYTDRLPVMERTLTVAAPGNHDILGGDLDKQADLFAYYYFWGQPLNGPITDPADHSATPLKGSDARRAAFRAAAGPNFPRMAMFSYDYGNAHWLFLDANPYVDWSDPKLRKWVEDDLARAAKKTWRFVAFHQPGFHSSIKHQEQKQMRLCAELFERGRVDVVFAGHVHNYQRSHPIQVGPKAGASREELAKDDWPLGAPVGATATRANGVVYIVDGAGGAPLYDPQLDTKRDQWKPFTAVYEASTFSLSVVDVHGSRLTLRQLDERGRVLDEFRLKAR